MPHKKWQSLVNLDELHTIWTLYNSNKFSVPQRVRIIESLLYIYNNNWKKYIYGNYNLFHLFYMIALYIFINLSFGATIYEKKGEVDDKENSVFKFWFSMSLHKKQVVVINGSLLPSIYLLYFFTYNSFLACYSFLPEFLGRWRFQRIGKNVSAPLLSQCTKRCICGQ